MISIHALRGEGDATRKRTVSRQSHFNPRPPWGGRLARVPRAELSYKFQSTPSVGRATPVPPLSNARCRYFNPRPPWGGRLGQKRLFEWLRQFQSTPSVGRATAPYSFQITSSKYFNPRPPWGGRPLKSTTTADAQRISIHALRGEGDVRGRVARNSSRHFNPRPPWGGRHRLAHSAFLLELFQSTPSVGRATGDGDERGRGIDISIHALRGEGDRSGVRFCQTNRDFNPRPPWGGRRA